MRLTWGPCSSKTGFRRLSEIAVFHRPVIASRNALVTRLRHTDSNIIKVDIWQNKSHK
jgi:hypothetical protein